MKHSELSKVTCIVLYCAAFGVPDAADDAKPDMHLHNQATEESLVQVLPGLVIIAEAASTIAAMELITKGK